MVPTRSPRPILGPSSASLGCHNYKSLFPTGTEGGTNQTLVSAHRPRPLGERKLSTRERTQPEVPPSHLQTAAGTAQSAAGTFAVSLPVRSVDPQGDTAAPQSAPRSHVG